MSDIDPGGGAGNSPSTTQSLVNRVLAERYDVLEMAGEGPLLAAYRARDRVLNRIVAIKAVLPRFAGRSDVLAKLRDGLSQVIALAHPNIVRAYDVRADASPAIDGQPFFLAEEYIRGIDLKERIRRAAPFQLAVATDTAIAVAEALEYAHARGVIHGDVRPQNILIGPDGQVKLTGFGIADAQALVISDDPSALKRVVPYISPDTARSASPTASGDLYAVGVVLFELLTGELPYKGDTALQMALRHAQDPIPSPRAVNTGVPRALDGVVQRALGKRPEERYASAAALLADLRAVRDALKYGRSLSWSPLDRAPETASVPVAATAAEDATIAGPVFGAPLPAPPPAPQITPDLLNRRVAPLSPPATLSASSPYANSSTGTHATPVSISGAQTLPVTSAIASAQLKEEPELVSQNARGGGGGGSRWLLSLNLALFLLALCGIGGLIWMTFYSLSPATEVVVPNLVGRSLTEARELAGEQHFDLAVVDTQFRDTDQKDVIYQMQPAPGRHIRSGRSISIWVSKGPRMMDVPDVRSTSFDKARTVIEKSEFKVGDYTFEFDTLEPKGNVIRQNPASGESRPRGAAIDLVLSKGEEPPPTPAPDLPTSDTTPSVPDKTPAQPAPDASPPSEGDSAADTRVRTFDIKYPVPADSVAHRVRIDVTDHDGTRTVYDDSLKAGDAVKQRIEAVGKSIRIRLFDNDALRTELVK